MTSNNSKSAPPSAISPTASNGGGGKSANAWGPPLPGGKPNTSPVATRPPNSPWGPVVPRTGNVCEFFVLSFRIRFSNLTSSTFKGSSKVLTSPPQLLDPTLLDPLPPAPLLVAPTNPAGTTNQPTRRKPHPTQSSASKKAKSSSPSPQAKKRTSTV